MKKIGPFVFFKDFGFFVGTPIERIGFYVDLPWNDEHRNFDAPCRVTLHLGPLGCVMFGYPYFETNTDPQFVWNKGRKRGWKVDDVQRWTFKHGYHAPRKWSWITWSPSQRLLCHNRVGQPLPLFPSKFSVLAARRLDRGPTWLTCGRLRWHRGPCNGGVPVTWQLSGVAMRKNDLI